jgi:hypothetical protein
LGPRGRRFKSARPDHPRGSGAVGSASAFQAVGYGFESRLPLSARGSIAQWQSGRLITGWSQVRTLVDPPPNSFVSCDSSAYPCEGSRCACHRVQLVLPEPIPPRNPCQTFARVSSYRLVINCRFWPGYLLLFGPAVPVSSSGRPHLPSCVEYRPDYRGWPEPHQGFQSEDIGALKKEGSSGRARGLEL